MAESRLKFANRKSLYFGKEKKNRLILFRIS